MELPQIIQGGMGVGVSGWRLARAVASAGHLGVVSGTALDVQLARRLQLGDPGGHLRRSMARFPDREMAARVLRRHFVAGGSEPGAPFARLARPSLDLPRPLVELTLLANFVEVDLAREGHGGSVGINYLEKIRLPTLPALYGALLAGVDYVLMGAGIPLEIPGVLDRLCRHLPVSLPLDVAGQPRDEPIHCHFDPAGVAAPPRELRRPLFLPIIAAASLAQVLVKRANGRVDGFVVEAPSAGGHNAPPRGPARFDAAGEPLYGPSDEVDLDTVRALGLPFWLAGSHGRPGMLAAARSRGAAGIQVGTAFAFCRLRHARSAGAGDPPRSPPPIRRRQVASTPPESAAAMTAVMSRGSPPPSPDATVSAALSGRALRPRRAAAAAAASSATGSPGRAPRSRARAANPPPPGSSF